MFSLWLFIFAGLPTLAWILFIVVKGRRAVKELNRKIWSEGNNEVFDAKRELNRILASDSSNIAWEATNGIAKLVEKLIAQDKREYPR